MDHRSDIETLWQIRVLLADRHLNIGSPCMKGDSCKWNLSS
jgi:hypothetical protein